MRLVDAQRSAPSHQAITVAAATPPAAPQSLTPLRFAQSAMAIVALLALQLSAFSPLRLDVALPALQPMVLHSAPWVLAASVLFINVCLLEVRSLALLQAMCYPTGCQAQLEVTAMLEYAKSSALSTLPTVHREACDSSERPCACDGREDTGLHHKLVAACRLQRDWPGSPMHYGLQQATRKAPRSWCQRPLQRRCCVWTGRNAWGSPLLRLPQTHWGWSPLQRQRRAISGATWHHWIRRPLLLRADVLQSRLGSKGHPRRTLRKSRIWQRCRTAPQT